MRDSAKNGKANALRIDPKATCSIIALNETGGKWAIVRDRNGKEIGRHRTAAFAWETAASNLQNPRRLKEWRGYHHNLSDLERA